MTIEKRLENLENLVNALSKKIDRNAYYTDADMNGNRQSISNTQENVNKITPFISTKTAFIDDTEVVFENVPQGNYTVYMTDTDGQNVPYTSERINGNIKVSFEKRTSLATVTISIL